MFLTSEALLSTGENADATFSMQPCSGLGNDVSGSRIGEPRVKGHL
jgi:hypothetical protein